MTIVLAKCRKAIAHRLGRRAVALLWREASFQHICKLTVYQHKCIAQRLLFWFHAKIEQCFAHRDGNLFFASQNVNDRRSRLVRTQEDAG